MRNNCHLADENTRKQNILSYLENILARRARSQGWRPDTGKMLLFKVLKHAIEISNSN